MQPATFSAAILDGVLRGELGYQGVIVSDALDMVGASGEIGIPAAAVRAIAAGCDLLCIGTKNTDEQLEAIGAALDAAVADGTLPQARLDDAVARNRALAAALAAPAPLERRSTSPCRRSTSIARSRPSTSRGDVVLEPGAAHPDPRDHGQHRRSAQAPWGPAAAGRRRRRRSSRATRCRWPDGRSCWSARTTTAARGRATRSTPRARQNPRRRGRRHGLAVARTARTPTSPRSAHRATRARPCCACSGDAS